MYSFPLFITPFCIKMMCILTTWGNTAKKHFLSVNRLHSTHSLVEIYNSDISIFYLDIFCLNNTKNITKGCTLKFQQNIFEIKTIYYRKLIKKLFWTKKKKKGKVLFFCLQEEKHKKAVLTPRPTHFFVQSLNASD